jgi:hypothetical protein
MPGIALVIDFLLFQSAGLATGAVWDMDSPRASSAAPRVAAGGPRFIHKPRQCGMGFIVGERRYHAMQHSTNTRL